MKTWLSVVVFLSSQGTCFGWIVGTPQQHQKHAGTTSAGMRSRILAPLSRPRYCYNDVRLASSLSASSNDDDEFLDSDAGDREAAADATPLSLSTSDLQRLSQLRQRQMTGLPIMILDAMLPGQQLECSLRDKRFRMLAKRVLQDEAKLPASPSLGMIGFDPATGNPLNVGVTVKILKLEIDESNNICTLGVEADSMFEVQNEPQLDETESYYTVDVELVEGRTERTLTDDEQKEAQRLHEEIPDLVQEWLEALYKSGRATPESMVPRYPRCSNNDNGTTVPHEDDIGARAVWTAALVNPLPSLGVCLEIRPSMLVCQNDLERVRLAHVSLKASIDHISGKQPLF